MSSPESLPANTEWASVHTFRMVTGGIAPGFAFAGNPINPYQADEYPLQAVPIPDFAAVPPSTARMSDKVPLPVYSQNNSQSTRYRSNRRG